MVSMQKSMKKHTADRSGRGIFAARRESTMTQLADDKRMFDFGDATNQTIKLYREERFLNQSGPPNGRTVSGPETLIYEKIDKQSGAPITSVKVIKGSDKITINSAYGFFILDGYKELADEVFATFREIAKDGKISGGKDGEEKQLEELEIKLANKVKEAKASQGRE